MSSRRPAMEYEYRSVRYEFRSVSVESSSMPLGVTTGVLSIRKHILQYYTIQIHKKIKHTGYLIHTGWLFWRILIRSYTTLSIPQ